MRAVRMLRVVLGVCSLLEVCSAALPSVLVTGATGFIGRVVVERLAARHDCEVYALVRGSPDFVSLPNGVHVRRGELGDGGSLAHIVEGMDMVVHLASVMDFYPSPDNAERMWQVNVNGTANLLEAAKIANVKRFIYISSTEAVGVCKDCSEDAKPNPHYLYGKSKLAAEKLVQQSGLPYIILRPTGVFGPRDTFSMHELMRMIWLGLLFFTPGDGTSLLMYTHVDDVASAIVHSVEADDHSHALYQTYFISPDEALDLKGWMAIIAPLVGRTILPWLHMPLPIVKAVTVAVAPIMNFNKERIFMYHSETIDRMGEDRSYSNAKARRLLHWRPAFSIRTGLENTIAWFKHHGEFYTTPVSPLAAIVLAVVIAVVVGVGYRKASRRRAKFD